MMPRIGSIAAAYGISVAFVLVFFSESTAQIPTGRELIDKMTERMKQENVRSRSSQTIETSSGQLRTFLYESYAADKGEKVLMRYQEPASVKGQAFLMLNNADDIWTYFPRTGRVRKLASHAKKQKVQGGDFTYEDLGSGDTWKEEYEPKNLGEDSYEEIPCWKLELMGIPEKDPAYPRILIWVRHDDSYPLKMDYYSEKGRVQKTLFLKDIRDVEGTPTAHKMIMKNLEDDTETRMEVLEMTYEWEPPKGFFSERNLKK